MTKKLTKKLLLVIILLLIVWSFVTIEYIDLSYFTASYIRPIVQGLLNPDWSYVYNGTSEDLLHLILDTVAIAFYGTLLGTLLSLPFVLLSSYSLWGRWTVVPRIGRGILNILRSIPTLIYAILFVRIVGPGEFAGGLAIGTQLVGMLGKLISEAMDNIDDTPVEAMASVGASSVQTFHYARLPQVMPIAISHVLNHFEISVRSATILGLVGGGGIGAPVIFALQARNWSRVSIILLSIILVVLVIDSISTAIRRRLV